MQQIKDRANKILYNVKQNQPIDDNPLLKDNEEEDK